MSEAERQQQKINQFMKLLPLTSELAGLPRCEPGHFLTEDQIAGRSLSMKAAYKVALELVGEISKQ